MVNKKAVKYGCVVAVLVLVFGFCTMCLLYFIWKKENPASTLPGLFYYKAAAIGDPICLPLLIGALFYHHVQQKKTIHSFGKASVVACIIMLIGGITIQAEWLINDNTGLNWSLPETHHFNLGGWYHAVFFVIILAAIALLLVEYLWYSSVLPHVILDSLIYFAAIFFFLLHYIDDYIDIEHPARSLALAAIVVIGFCMVLKMVQHIKLKSSGTTNYIAVLASGILAYLLGLTQI